MKQIKKAGSRKGTILLQINENNISAVKSIAERAGRCVFTALALSQVGTAAHDDAILSALKDIFKKLNYSNDRVVVSLASHQATHRYLKVPTQIPHEIEQIIAFQAPKYLPYAVQELVTGYHVIRVDRDGYAHINLIIMPKDASQRYCSILETLGVKDFSITLGSYGLAYLYHVTEPKTTAPVLLVDVDPAQVELAIVQKKEVLLSRSFKPYPQKDFRDALLEEIQKTNTAYAKETSAPTVSHIGLLGAGSDLNSLAQWLQTQTSLDVKTVAYQDTLGLSGEFLASLKAQRATFAGLMGLALYAIPESLNLIPGSLKDAHRKYALRQKRARMLLMLAAIVCVFFFAVQKTIDNKAQYSTQLRQHFATIAKEARPLEDLEKRLKLLYGRAQKEPTALDSLYELHRIMPSEIHLTTFSYEEDGLITLRGQAQELSLVFSLVTALENSVVFSKFAVKVRYATKKKNQTGEAADFEIVCTKEK